MMEYRHLPRGKDGENLSVIGLGMGGIQGSTDSEIEKVVRIAIDNGINFFDLCAGGSNVYAPFGRAIRGQREKVMFQLHLGAVYNEKGEYGWSRDLVKIERTFYWQLKTLGVNYVDFVFLHCVDEEEDFVNLVSAGVLDFAYKLKNEGVARHIGFSSHTPSVASTLIDNVDADLMMFSVNPAYDLEFGDETGLGTNAERRSLFSKCKSEGVGITVMKPFQGGKLLQASTSPFGTALSRTQCISYALDRPGVLSVLPGVRGLSDLNILLEYLDASERDKDYSEIADFVPESIRGSCVYCNHCLPCPRGINIGLVNKYYDLALAGDKMAAKHYEKLAVKAGRCADCGHCNKRCPFFVKQSEKMREIAAYFGE